MFKGFWVYYFTDFRTLNPKPYTLNPKGGKGESGLPEKKLSAAAVGMCLGV